MSCFHHLICRWSSWGSDYPDCILDQYNIEATGPGELLPVVYLQYILNIVHVAATAQTNKSLLLK